MCSISINEWQAAREDGERYQVTVCWATYRTECPSGMVDTVHYFGSKVRAEQFAREISYYIGGKTSDGCPIAWVLVSALATTLGNAISYGGTYCYLSYDRGAVQVKRHEIGRGYFGAKCTHCLSNLEAA
jgi:hypothetical protein